AQAGEAIRSTAPLSKPITGVRWSRAPGAEFIAATCGDHQVHLWNARNTSNLRTLATPDDYLFGLSLASTRSRLATGGAQGTLYLWDSGTGQLVRKFPAGTPLEKND
ncbi:MAG TPA: hypothetical protein VFT74_21970, partial [Isosphaeraceae bacterium]|nr:hypothetical protein [Isosphaeraceae bacterium]